MITPRRFYESLFTDFDDQGISGVFPQAAVQEIARIVKQIRDKAAA